MKHKNAVQLLVILVIALTITNCSYLKESRRINLAPFADNTISMIADIRYGLDDVRPVYIYPHIHGPGVDSMRIRVQKLRAVVRGMVAYSIELVSISESSLSGKERCDALAQFLDDLLRPVLISPKPNLHISIAEFDTILANVREEKKLLDGVNAAQRIVDEISRVMGELIIETKTFATIAVTEIGANIDGEHKEILDYYRTLKEYQKMMLATVKLYVNYRAGDTSALPEMYKKVPSLRAIPKSQMNPTAEELLLMEDRLIQGLERITNMKQALVPELEIYWKQQVELDKISDAIDKGLNKVQAATIVWSRTHRQMAAGIINPAKVDVFSLTKKAISTAL
jgi:hypothetical protein